MQPVGFLCDHVEILYDIDIAFSETAQRTWPQTLARRKSQRLSAILVGALTEVVTGQYKATVDEVTIPAEV